MGETENEHPNKGVQKQLLQLINQKTHGSTMPDAATSLKGAIWSKVMNNTLALQQNDKRMGIPGESGDGCQVLKRRRCLRNTAKSAAVFGLTSVVAGRGSGRKQLQRQVVYRQCYRDFLRECFSRACSGECPMTARFCLLVRTYPV